jgi:hypothetical protein
LGMAQDSNEKSGKLKCGIRKKVSDAIRMESQPFNIEIRPYRQ